MKHFAITLLLLCVTNTNLFAQYDVDPCYALTEGLQEVQTYVEKGKYEEALKMLENMKKDSKLNNCPQMKDGYVDYKINDIKKKLAENGDAVSQYNMAEKYYYGRGITQDYEEAVEWYRKAAEKGYAKAQCMLGYCYDKGLGVPQDYKQGVELYRKAAEQGDITAQGNLGICYYNGHGVPKDYKKAVEWYQKAADNGNVGALRLLGTCYENGQGVPKDYAKAVECYRKAAEKGDEDSKKKFESLNEKTQQSQQSSSSSTMPSYKSCPDNKHPHLIDLGLPSGTKWACCNIGANKPEDYGGYYAWGEIEGKDKYNNATYKYNNVSLGSDIAGTQYDVAHIQWRGSWVMPSQEQFKELLDKCTHKWTTVNGVKGRSFTGPNGSTIFLPAAGGRYNEVLYNSGTDGSYSTSTHNPMNPHSAYVLTFNSSNASLFGSYGRDNGHTVRPISK